MLNSYEVTISLWSACVIAILYWVVWRSRGHLVAGVSTAVMALFSLLIIFASYLSDLLGNGQWAILTLSALGLAGVLVRWFSKKYGKFPQKQ
jgi:hypothetical protein